MQLFDRPEAGQIGLVMPRQQTEPGEKQFDLVLPI